MASISLWNQKERALSDARQQTNLNLKRSRLIAGSSQIRSDCISLLFPYNPTFESRIPQFLPGLLIFGSAEAFQHYLSDF